MITYGLLATSTGQATSLGAQILTSFLVGLVGGAAAVLLAWVGLLNKMVEKRIDDRIESRRAMWGNLMEPDKFEQLQKITSLAYVARNAARDFVQSQDGSDSQTYLDEFRMAASSYQKSIEENRYLLESVVGAFAEAHALKAAMLTFKNTVAGMRMEDDSAEISDRYEKLNTQFGKFSVAVGQWFPRLEGARRQ
jgi:hypothetical protein